MPLNNLECYIVAYKEQAKTQRAIDTFRETGGDCKLTILDNSPQPLSFDKIDQHYSYPFNPSLTRVWNWSIAMSRTPWTLISNTDVEFRRGWVDHFKEFQDHGVHNNFYSFFIHKECVKKVGWFDERFTEGYWEDVDYVRRMMIKGVPWHAKCLKDYIVHHHDDNDPRYPGQFPGESGYEYYGKKWGDHLTDKSFDKGNTRVSNYEDFNWYPRVEL